MSFRILLVDDDPEALQSTAKILRFAEYDVVEAESAEKAIAEIKKQKPNLIVTDVRMPGMSGLEFIESCQRMGFSIPFIVMTAFGEVNDAVWAMKMGAVDFLLKPFKRQSLLEAIHQMQSVMAAKSQGSQGGRGAPQEEMVGSSRAMRELRVQMDQVSRTDASVLILGESGSGKEQVAKAIHEKSAFGQGPFIAVNCAAIPENLIESELFGYERGAFSGATQSKIGLIEAANGGTLLLDEIGDMPLSLQPKLLRFLEEQTIRKVGATTEKKVKVRVIAATHRSLSQWVKDQKFRQDLYYRLDVMTIHVPSLRERLEDLPELTQYFLSRFSKEHQKTIVGIDTEAQAILMNHEWPGNVRELSNVLERAVVLNASTLIKTEDLPAHLLPTTKPAAEQEQVTIPLGMSLREIEDLMIKRALQATDGDRGLAARLLGVNERTIYRRMSKTKEE